VSLLDATTPSDPTARGQVTNKCNDRGTGQRELAKGNRPKGNRKNGSVEYSGFITMKCKGLRRFQQFAWVGTCSHVKFVSLFDILLNRGQKSFYLHRLMIEVYGTYTQASLIKRLNSETLK